MRGPDYESESIELEDDEEINGSYEVTVEEAESLKYLWESMCSMEGIRFEISEVSLAELRSWYRYRYPAPVSGRSTKGKLSGCHSCCEGRRKHHRRNYHIWKQSSQLHVFKIWCGICTKATSIRSVGWIWSTTVRSWLRNTKTPYRLPSKFIINTNQAPMPEKRLYHYRGIPKKKLRVRILLFSTQSGARVHNSHIKMCVRLT